jgi:hypothetical protein
MKLKRLGASSTEVYLSEDIVILFSYETPVACRIAGRGFFKTSQYYSKTTAKHIGAWLARRDRASADMVRHVG